VASIVRCSGRLFWPLAYTAVLLALITLFRVGGKVMAWGLSLAIVLQIADMAPFAAAIRSRTAEPQGTQPMIYTKSPQWDALVSHADEVLFEPPHAAVAAAHKSVLYEIAYRAISRNIPVNTMYAARVNARQETLEERGYRDFKGGAISSGDLYILISHCSPPAALASRLRVLDDIWFIPPESQSNVVDAVPAAPEYKVATTYDFDENTQAICQLDSNWAEPESTWVWSEGSQSSLTLPIHIAQPRDLTLHINASTYAKDKVAGVIVNGVELSRLDMSQERKDYVVNIPAADTHPDGVTIGFTVEPMSDELRARKHESRHLGIRLYSLRVD